MLVFYGTVLITAVKSFMILATGAIEIKHFSFSLGQIKLNAFSMPFYFPLPVPVTVAGFEPLTFR
jgi:hypothetical protein